MFKLSELAKYTNGNMINGNKDKQINDFSLHLKNFGNKDYFFIPIIFKNVNREAYIIDHVKNGCIGFMISKTSKERKNIEELAIKLNPEICILEVESVNDALVELGKKCREKNITKPVIAVTGSVGKTTLCSIIAKILETEINVLHDFKNENNNTKCHISLSYLFFDNYDMAVTEIGISDIGMMNLLSDLTKPSIAVINNIGTAHLNKFKTKENILKEKMHIADYLKDKKILFINKDCEILQNINSNENYSVIHYSSNEISDFIEDDNGIRFKTKIYGKETSFNLNLYGKYNATNIVLAIKIAEMYNISYENIIKAINNFESVSGRLKVLKNEQRQLFLIDDAYSSSFESVKLGLDTANKINSNRKIAVLGKMAAYGENANEYHEKLGEYFKNLNFDYIYLTGESTKHIFKGALKNFKEKNIKRFKTKEALTEELEKNIKNGDLIYIKAANTQNFSSIVNELKIKYNFI